MTKLERLEIENELMREYRTWYNPAIVTDEQLQENIATQKQLVKIFEEKFKSEEDEVEKETVAKVLTTEVMKMVIWEDIFFLRNPDFLPIELEG